MIAGFAVFHMANAVGVLKHRLQRPVVEISVAGHHGIREVRQGVKIGMVDLLDHFHHEERILADQIVILQIDDDIFPRSVLDHFPQAFRRALHTWHRVGWSVNVRTDAGGSDLDGYVYPLFCISNCFLASGRIPIIKARLSTDGDIHNLHARLSQRFPENA